jgi:hypothetical protein
MERTRSSRDLGSEFDIESPYFHAVHLPGVSSAT